MLARRSGRLTEVRNGVRAAHSDVESARHINWFNVRFAAGKPDGALPCWRPMLLRAEYWVNTPGHPNFVENVHLRHARVNFLVLLSEKCGALTIMKPSITISTK